MTTTPSADGGSIERTNDWFDDLVVPLEKLVEASAEEARALGGGIRKTLSVERLDRWVASIRQRLRREAVSERASIDPAVALRADDLALRARVIARPTEGTIEEWDRHVFEPPVMEF